MAHNIDIQSDARVQAARMLLALTTGDTYAATGVLNDCETPWALAMTLAAWFSNRLTPAEAEALATMHIDAVVAEANGGDR